MSVASPEVEENLVHHVDAQLTTQPLDSNLTVGNFLLELGDELVLGRLKLGQDCFFGLHLGFELFTFGSNFIEQVLKVRNAAVQGRTFLGQQTGLLPRVFELLRLRLVVENEGRRQNRGCDEQDGEEAQQLLMAFS